MIEAIILAVQTIMVAVIGVIGKWVLTAKTQVKNDHKTNLRDDIDNFRDDMNRNHSETMRELGKHDSRLDRLEGRVYTNNVLIERKVGNE